MRSTFESDRSIIVHAPGTDTVVWQGIASSSESIADSVATARDALLAWQSTSIDERVAVAERFAALSESCQDAIANQISLETSKPVWESHAEAKLIPSKVKLSIEAYRGRCGRQQIALAQGNGGVFYRGVGVMAVLGPFNFPAHLPNGHIVPALIAGNSVVFKPSERTPGTGDLLCRLWNQAGLPDGVLQIVHGGGDVGASLVQQPIDGILFTGSHSVGCAIHRSIAGRPEVMLALEMGGNNPLIVYHADDLDAAAYVTAVSAYASAGQRCTCARRLIVPEDARVETLLNKVGQYCRQLRVGLPGDDPQPFMGPLISTEAADRVIEAQAALITNGAVAVVPAERVNRNPALIRPGLIDVTGLQHRNDEEVFGPLLQVIRVPDFQAAIAEANRTAYGLSASLLSDDADAFDRFRQSIRAGVVNWNQATIGASGRLPFGGLGTSGNHRPSGFFAADYCSDAVATLESTGLSMPSTMLPGMELGA